jgi:hypothetical protein
VLEVRAMVQSSVHAKTRWRVLEVRAIVQSTCILAVPNFSFNMQVQLKTKSL